MSAPSPERPDLVESSALWPSTSANSFRREHLAPAEPVKHHDQIPSDHDKESDQHNNKAPSAEPGGTSGSASEKTDRSFEQRIEKAQDEDIVDFEPIKTKSNNVRRYEISSTNTDKPEEDLFKIISRKRTNASGRQGSYISSGHDDEQAEIERLMSRMFGRNRQENSEEEKSRHVGLVFKNLTVKGMGLGAALQPTLSDIFLGLPRRLRSRNKRSAGQPPIRTILKNITGCIRPGEMLLVLGRPGSGCSTFLKALANQRFGYESVEGDVSYGGTDAKIMGKDYRGEIVYNPEDDLHYATLSVKRTLAFALKTRTPKKASRNEGETRKEYVREFLRVVAKLFWIEHTV